MSALALILELSGALAKGYTGGERSASFQMTNLIWSRNEK